MGHSMILMLVVLLLLLSACQGPGMQMPGTIRLATPSPALSAITPLIPTEPTVLPTQLAKGSPTVAVTPPVSAARGWSVLRNEWLGVEVQYPTGWQVYSTGAFAHFFDAPDATQGFGIANASFAIPIKQPGDWLAHVGPPVEMTRTLTLDGQPALFMQFEPGAEAQGIKSMVGVVTPYGRGLTIDNRTDPDLFEHVLSSIRFFKPIDLERAAQLTVTAAPIATPTVSPFVRKNATGGFPFPTGTMWVYSRVQYQQAKFDPATIITATNLITATVIRTEVITPSVAMQYKETASLVSAPPGWEDNSANFKSEFWYLLAGNHVFSSPEQPKSPEPLEIDVKGERTPLVYDFPLIGGKNWCPFNPPPSYNPNCVAMGRRTVVQTGSYTTPVGIFDECYQITEEYNSGGVTEWFCNGVGVVARKYDHSGTRFGFEDTLISYSRGSAQRFLLPFIPATLNQ